MSEEKKQTPETDNAEILLGHDGKVLGISMDTNIDDDGSYHIEITKGNIDIIKNDEIVSSVTLSDDIPKEIYDGLAEEENITLISDQGTVMTVATLTVDKDSTDNAPTALVNVPDDKKSSAENIIDYTSFRQMMEDTAKAEKLRQATMEEFKGKQNFNPPPAANSNIINEIKSKGPEEFIAQAQAAEPLKIGDSVAGKVDSVASIGASQDKSRVKEILKFVGGVALPLFATMAVKMTIGAAITAAVPAIAPIAVPLLFAGYSAYKLIDKAKEKEDGNIFEKLGAAVKENKFEAGMLLGALAVGIAARTGGLEFIADFLDDEISAFMGNAPEVSETATLDTTEVSETATLDTTEVSETATLNTTEVSETANTVMPLPDEYADLNAGEMKEKAFELFNGRGGEEVDQAMALKLFEEAAEMGNEDAKVDLAYIQYHGLAGVEQDQEAAVATMKEMGKTEWLGGQDIPELNPTPEIDAPSPINMDVEGVIHEGWEDYPAFPEGSEADVVFGERLAEAIEAGTATAEGGIATIDPESNQMYFTHEMENGNIVTHVVEMDEYKSAEFLQDANLGMMDSVTGYDADEMNGGMENILDFAAEQGGSPAIGVVIGFVNDAGGADTTGNSIDVHAFKDDDGNMQYKIITDEYLEENSGIVKLAAEQTMQIEEMGNQIVFSDDFKDNTENMTNNTGDKITFPTPEEPESSYPDIGEEDNNLDDGDDNGIGWGAEEDKPEPEDPLGSSKEDPRDEEWLYGDEWDNDTGEKPEDSLGSSKEDPRDEEWLYGDEWDNDTEESKPEDPLGSSKDDPFDENWLYDDESSNDSPKEEAPKEEAPKSEAPKSDDRDEDWLYGDEWDNDNDAPKQEAQTSKFTASDSGTTNSTSNSEAKSTSRFVETKEEKVEVTEKSEKPTTKGFSSKKGGP